MSRPRPAGIIKKKLIQTKLPEWVSKNLGSADDPMGMLAAGTIVIAIGLVSFRLWRRRHRRGGASGKAKP